MKKHATIYAVFALALGAVLITAGILGIKDYANSLSSSNGETGSIIVYLFVYLFMALLALFILAGIPYLVNGTICLYAAAKHDPFRLQKNLQISKKLNTYLLIIIILYDLSTIGRFFKDWNENWQMNIMSLLLIALTVAVQISVIKAIKKVKDELANENTSAYRCGDGEEK